MKLNTNPELFMTHKSNLQRGIKLNCEMAMVFRKPIMYLSKHFDVKRLIDPSAGSVEFIEIENYGNCQRLRIH